MFLWRRLNPKAFAAVLEALARRAQAKEGKKPSVGRATTPMPADRSPPPKRRSF